MEKSAIETQLKALFGKHAKNIYPNYNADDISLEIQTWQPTDEELAMATAAIVHLGQCIPIGGVVTFEFNSLPEKGMVIAIANALEEKSSIPTTCSEREVTLHAPPNTILNRLKL